MLLRILLPAMVIGKKRRGKSPARRPPPDLHLPVIKLVNPTPPQPRPQPEKAAPGIPDPQPPSTTPPLPTDSKPVDANLSGPGNYDPLPMPIVEVGQLEESGNHWRATSKDSPVSGEISRKTPWLLGLLILIL